MQIRLHDKFCGNMTGRLRLEGDYAVKNTGMQMDKLAHLPTSSF